MLEAICSPRLRRGVAVRRTTSTGELTDPLAPKLIQQLSRNTFNTDSTEDTEKGRENAISIFSSVLSVSSVFKSL